MSESRVDLGFVEECEKWEIKSPHFPSKVGAQPAWLQFEDLPKLEDIQCNNCKQQMIFLLQIYAPFEEDDTNFHRILFIFMCKNVGCCKRNVSTNLKVFRNSLPRKNSFYSFEPPDNNKPIEFDSSKWVKLCRLCGCTAEQLCSKCKQVSYCCKQHQVIDWKENHNHECGKGDYTRITSKYLFKEYELVMEREKIQIKLVDESKELETYKNLEREGKTGTLNNISESEFIEKSSANKDKVFQQFLKRTSEGKQQVLRYERGGEPLWISEAPIPEAVPHCEYCGSARRYEFQVMPQLLSFLNETNLDFGVLVVYTCQRSCTDGQAYKEEFLFRQDVSDAEN